MSGKRISIRARRAVSGYLFILPFIIGFLCFMLLPLVDSFWMSLCRVDVTAGQGFQTTFIGLDNYIRAFTIDPEFNKLLSEEIGVMVTHTIAILVVSFVIAIVLNQEFKGRAFVRAIFFLPVILSSGVLIGLETDNTLMAGMQQMMAESSPFTLSESLMKILKLTGIGSDVLDIVFSLIDEVYDIVMASGIQIVVFLSAERSAQPVRSGGRRGLLEVGSLLDDYLSDGLPPADCQHHLHHHRLLHEDRQRSHEENQ